MTVSEEFLLKAGPVKTRSQKRFAPFPFYCSFCSQASPNNTTLRSVHFVQLYYIMIYSYSIYLVCEG